MLFATSHPRDAVRLYNVVAPCPEYVAVTLLTAVVYSVGMEPTTCHRAGEVATSVRVNAGTFGGSVRFTLAGGAEPI